MFSLCSINQWDRVMDIRARNRRCQTNGGRELAVWSAGLLCGLGGAAANQALLLPLGLALALAGGLPLIGLALRWLLRPRPRAVVWQEPSWDAL
jgi:hypothetical protein